MQIDDCNNKSIIKWNYIFRYVYYYYVLLLLLLAQKGGDGIACGEARARGGGGDEAKSLGHIAIVQVGHQVAPVRVLRPPQQSTAPTALRGVLYVRLDVGEVRRQLKFGYRYGGRVVVLQESLLLSRVQEEEAPSYPVRVAGYPVHLQDVLGRVVRALF